MPPHFAIRPAVLADVGVIVEHRCGMFTDMGFRDAAAIDKMYAAFPPWLEQKMRRNEYLAWLAVDPNGAIAAGLGLWLMDWPPHMIGTGRWRGNIINVYTRPESRRMGLAHRLVDAALEWCRANDVGMVILHASDDGRPLYQSMGFQAAANEMRLVLGSDTIGS